MSKWWLVCLEPGLMVKTRCQAEVTQIYLATALTVRQRQCYSQAPLSHNADMSTGWIQAQHGSLVCIGPLNHGPVPCLVWWVNITIQCRNNYIHRTGRQTCIQSDTNNSKIIHCTSNGRLTAQVGWLGLRVGGLPALSLHSSNEPGELSQWPWSWGQHHKHCGWLLLNTASFMNKKTKNGNLTLIRLPKTKTSCPVLHLLLLLLLLLRPLLQDNMH